MFKDRNRDGEHCNMTLLNWQENKTMEINCEKWPGTYKVRPSGSLHPQIFHIWWTKTKKMGRCGLVVAWPETILWPWLWPLSVGKAWLYMDIVGSLFPQICQRVQHRENAWPDPYMVTLGWVCATWWELRGRSWTSICWSKACNRILTLDWAWCHFRESVGEPRQRYAAAQHANSHNTHIPSWYCCPVNLGGKLFNQLILLSALWVENGYRHRYQVKWCALLWIMCHSLMRFSIANAET